MSKKIKFIPSITFTIIFLIFTAYGQSENNQTEFNLGFEKVSEGAKLPDKWFQFGSGYTLKIDTAEKKSGNNSVLIEPPKEKAENTFGSVASTIPANYQGKEIKLRGFLKLKDVSGVFAGLWMRIDGDEGYRNFV